MPENSIIHGSCICGRVELTIPRNCPMTICHCMSCRKASGSTHSGNFSVDEKDLQIMGHPKIYVDKGISGKEVYRHFCGDCGSPAYTKTEIPGPVYVKIGLFQVDDVDPPSTHVFAKNLAKWEETYPNTKVLETQ